jgi:tetratricopeptide (TPR) repeat protein
MGMALTGRGLLPQALACLEEALALSDPEADRASAIRLSSNPRVTALAYKALVLEAMGAGEEAEACDAMAIADAEAGQHLPTLGLAATLHLSRLLVRHDPAAIAEAAMLLHGHAVKQESMPLQAVAGSVLGLLRARDAPEEAIFAAVRQTVGAIRAAGWNLMVAWIGLLEAEVSLEHGRVEAARETLLALRSVVEPRGHHFFLPELLRLLGEAARLSGDHAGAAAHLGEAIRIAGGQGARAVEARAAADHARLHEAGSLNSAGAVP